MISNNTVKEIKDDIKKGRFLYIESDHTRAIKYIRSEFKAQYVGPVYLLLGKRINTNELHQDYLGFMGLLNQHVYDTDIYKNKHGLFIIGTSSNRHYLSKFKPYNKHTGYIIATHNRPLTEWIKEDRERNNSIYDFQITGENVVNTIRMIAYYLLTNHNLYWNQNCHEYRVHNRTLLNWFIPRIKHESKDVLHMKRQWFLLSAITDIRYVFNKFVDKNTKDWSLSNGVVPKLSEQINLFHPNKATHSQHLLTINPSQFIHELAAVDDYNVFSVLTNYDNMDESGYTNYDKNGKHIYDPAPEKVHQDVIKLHRYDAYSLDNGQIQSDDCFNIIKNHLWGTITSDDDSPLFTVPDKNGLYDNLYITSELSILAYQALSFDVRFIKKDIPQDILIENKHELHFYEDLMQKAYPDGCTYNYVKYGKHLYDFVFQPTQTEFCNKIPKAELPTLALNMRIKGSKDVGIKGYDAKVRTDQPKALIFGDPYRIKNTIKMLWRVDSSYKSPYELSRVDEDMGPIDDFGNPIHSNKIMKQVKDSISDFNIRPVICNWDSYERSQVYVDEKEIAKYWLKDNKAYRNFIANI